MGQSPSIQRAQRCVAQIMASMILDHAQSTSISDLEEFMEFWSKSGVDTEHGGFVCALDHEGNRLQDEKYIWYQISGSG